MKKLIAIAVVFALVAGAVFAQDEEAGIVKPGITISGSAGATFVPFILGGPQYKGDGGMFKIDQWQGWENGGYLGTKPKVDSVGELYTGLYGYGVNVNVSGTSEYAGFGIGFNSGGVTGGSFWVQPLGTQALRFGFSSGNLSITSNGLVEGLRIGLTLPKLLSSTYDGKLDDYKDINSTFVDAWRQLQVSVGYTIADIGTISAGYNGGWAEKIDFNNLTDFQYVYKYNRAPPTNPRAYAGKGISGFETTWQVPSNDGTGPEDGGDTKWAWDGDPDFDGLFLTAKKNPILAVEELGYSDAFFSAGFNLSALSNMGLTIGLSGKFYLPQEAKYAGQIRATDITGGVTGAGVNDPYTVERKNSGWVDLSLSVNYTNADFNVGFNFSAEQLGKSNTLTRTGAGTYGININSELNTDDNAYKTLARYIGTTETVEPVKMSIGVNPSYKIDGTTIGLRLGVDFTSEKKTTTSGFDQDVTGAPENEADVLGKDSEAQYKFGAYVNFKPFGKATLSVGINVATPVLLTAGGAGGSNPANTAPIPKGEKSRFFISVPITFGVNF
jgi:hypothetical protein